MDAGQKSINNLSDHLNQVVVGQEDVVKALMIALLTGGHVLLEGLPGTAKTRSVKALAEALDLPFGRIQFTPDLLPSDVTGSEVYQEINGKPSLSFKPGPVFNSVVLADEINRAPAKVQAALLEAMAEGTLTAAGKTQHLPDPFMVLATQNPIEQEGTYPLPEAQMDRFVMKVNIPYPKRGAEKQIMRLVRGEELIDNTMNQDQNSQDGTGKKHSFYVDVADVLAGKQAIKSIQVSESIEQYIVDIVMATREPELYPDSTLSQWIGTGASPRATIALDRCSRAHAWLSGRDYVTPDDVRSIVKPVLGHRIILNFDAVASNVTTQQVVEHILEHVILS